jgi:Tat protein translocase TatB subunit
MFNLGFFEIMVIVILALVLIGPEQMPEVARNIGKLFRDIKRITNEMTDSLQREASKINFEQESLKKDIQDSVKIDFLPDSSSVKMDKSRAQQDTTPELKPNDDQKS